jgi:YegS/Rv2252/BmrU family lipid kinase
MKIGLIVNPNSGTGSFRNQLREAQDYLLKRGCQLKRFDTTAKGDATRLARHAANHEDFDVVVAVGGDGTLNEVCNGLVGSSVALGVLPAGTGNVFAADVGLPIWAPLNPDAILKATEIIITGTRHQIDLGHVQVADGTSRHFLMWCGIGLDAAITQSKDASSTPRSLNYASWIISGIMVAADFMGTPATLTLDDRQFRKRLLMAVASNGQLYGRVWRLAPEAKMDDGLLDVAVMAGHHWPSTIRHVLGLTFKRNIKDPDFHVYRTRRLALTARSPLPVHVDAEFIGNTPVEIEIVPGAITIILPPEVPQRLFTN